MTSCISLCNVVWSLLNCLCCFTSGQCQSISCLTFFIATAVLKHRWAEEINFLDAANLFAQALHHAKKSHYNQNVFQISLRLAPLLKQSEISIHRLFHFDFPSGYWSQHQVFIWVNFVPPRSGMCSDLKPLILHKHVTSVTLLSEGFISAAFSFFFFSCRRLSHSVTSQISNTYTESGTE